MGVKSIIWLAMLVVVVSSLAAAQTVSADLSLDCDPLTWNIGIIRASTTVSTGLDYFTCNNTGDTTIDVQISSDNMTGIIKVWNLSDTGTPGDSIYGMKAGQPLSYWRIGFATGESQTSLGFSGGDEWETVGYIWEEGYMVVVKRTSAYNYLFVGLPPAGIFKWGLEFYSPTSNIGNEEMEGTVTLTASQHT